MKPDKLHITRKIERDEDELDYGPISPLLADPAVSEVMVNSWDRVFVERSGTLEEASVQFHDEAAVMDLANRIARAARRHIAPECPMLDARLRDGSRVNIILPPLAVKGASITIRRFANVPFTIKDLIEHGALTPAAAQFLEICVKNRKNIVISGGASTGKTTLLNVLSSLIPPSSRIITVEDAAELRLWQKNVVYLEARPGDPQRGEHEVTIRQLVKNALRMRPDRIVVGECRGGEVLDMLIAMNTGLEGSMTTAHGNSPRDIMNKLETMALMSGMDIPERALREQVASAIDIVVHLQRFPEGRRKVTHIVEVTGCEGNRVLMMDIFLYRSRGRDANGKIVGDLMPTEMVPSFVGELIRAGQQVPVEIFHGARA
ncbi:MAG: CpaF family protein [Candidatus Schekmanbacteria bacterium]|nr:CpaF family protein [Candidatus Schekmanbacteria bacterium]